MARLLGFLGGCHIQIFLATFYTQLLCTHILDIIAKISKICGILQGWWVVESRNRTLPYNRTMTTQHYPMLASPSASATASASAHHPPPSAHRLMHHFPSPPQPTHPPRRGHGDPARRRARRPCAVGDAARQRGGRAGPDPSSRVWRGTPRHVVLGAGVPDRRRWALGEVSPRRGGVGTAADRGFGEVG